MYLVSKRYLKGTDFISFLEASKTPENKTQLPDQRLLAKLKILLDSTQHRRTALKIAIAHSLPCPQYTKNSGLSPVISVKDHFILWKGNCYTFKQKYQCCPRSTEAEPGTEPDIARVVSHPFSNWKSVQQYGKIERCLINSTIAWLCATVQKATQGSISQQEESNSLSR